MSPLRNVNTLLDTQHRS